MESELYAACDIAKIIRYVRIVLKSLGINISTPTMIFEDNAAAIAVTNNERAMKRLRHVDIRHFAILEWVQNSEIKLHPISTYNNPADGLTKPLPVQLHNRHSNTLLGKRLPICN